MKGLIFVISGPSGSGKTTLLECLLEDQDLKPRIAKSISFTTRPKRSGEWGGEDYFFLTKKEFAKKLKTGKILEWTEYLDHYYGTPRDFVGKQIKKKKNLVLCLDLKGALKIKKLYPKNSITIFLLPPSLGTLETRIKKRCPKTGQEEIKQRLQIAQKELLAPGQYDYCLVNRDLAKTVKQLKSIILNEIKTRA